MMFFCYMYGNLFFKTDDELLMSAYINKYAGYSEAYIIAETGDSMKLDEDCYSFLE